MTASSPLQDWLPPVLRRWLGQATGRSVRFTGGWRDWAAASAAARGYDDDSILRRVVQATRQVEAGRAAFERDSVLFDRWSAPFQLLAPLLRHALQNEGHLEVVDFGGSLGSSWRQCMPFLPPLASLRWRVVEQPGFVAAGRAEFGNDVLSFHESMADLPPASVPRLLLVSSVLQYLAAPLEHVAEWAMHDFATLVIDRTHVWDGDDHRVCVQHVPSHIYPGSYPCWIFSRRALMQRLAIQWNLLCEFDCIEGRHTARGGPSFEFKGFILERKPA